MRIQNEATHRVFGAVRKSKTASDGDNITIVLSDGREKCILEKFTSGCKPGPEGYIDFSERDLLGQGFGPRGNLDMLHHLGVLDDAVAMGDKVTYQEIRKCILNFAHGGKYYRDGEKNHVIEDKFGVVIAREATAQLALATFQDWVYGEGNVIYTNKGRGFFKQPMPTPKCKWAGAVFGKDFNAFVECDDCNIRLACKAKSESPTRRKNC